MFNLCYPIIFSFVLLSCAPSSLTTKTETSPSKRSKVSSNPNGSGFPYATVSLSSGSVDGYINDFEKSDNDPLLSIEAPDNVTLSFEIIDAAVDCKSVTSFGFTSVPLVADLTTDGSYRVCVKLTPLDSNVDPVVLSSPIIIRDTTSPLSGNLGSIFSNNINGGGFTASWTKGTDDLSLSAALQYLVYYSTSNNLSTKADVIANGTAFGSYSSDINTKVVTGLSSLTLYYFNVLVKDGAGNVSAYASNSFTTIADSVVPTVGNSGILSSSLINSTGFTTSWTKGTDDVSLPAALQYQVYYSTSNNISSKADVLANGTAFGSYSTDIGTKVVTGLSPRDSLLCQRTC